LYETPYKYKSCIELGCCIEPGTTSKRSLLVGGTSRAYLINQTVGAHGRSYCSLSNEFSTEGVRAYGSSFGENRASKYTKISPFSLPYLNPSITSSYYKNTISRSSLASLFITFSSDVIAILIIIIDSIYCLTWSP